MQLNSQVCGIVIKVNDKLPKVSDIKILGRSCLQWVELSLGDSFYTSIDADAGADVLQVCKNHTNPKSTYTVLLYSDTPLITKRTVLQILDIAVQKNLNVLKMTRGWVFKTAHLMESDSVIAPSESSFLQEEFLIADSFKQVALITNYLKNRILDYHMKNGVHIVDPPSVFIDCEVYIGKNVTIEPNNIIKNRTEIKDNVLVSSGNVLDDVILDSFVTVNSSNLMQCYVGKDSKIGPYARIRPESVIGCNCKIGNFVEIKNSVIGDNTKISHHTYVGDATIGDNCNIGCGVVFCNFDGQKKHNTCVGNGAFVGANSTLIAPVSLSQNSYVAAGSTINQNVEENSLAIARARQQNKQGWYKMDKNNE
ncbi:MAG: hypothetical protein LBU60_01820 [Clostridiales bacterium]|nr:hypothetical protein [Clostridiales bacterium]